MTEKMYESWFEQLEGKVTQCTIYTTDKWNIYIAYDKFIIILDLTLGLAGIVFVLFSG